MMKRDRELISRSQKHQGSIYENIKVQSLQEKTGATAEQIRRAIEIVGFNRDKVEQYIIENK